VRSRRGEQKAIVALAHQLLTIIFHIIADQSVYQELGAVHYDQQNKPKVTRKLIERLTRLGYYVTLQPIPTLGPVPPPYQPTFQPSVAVSPPPAAPTAQLPRRRGRPCKCGERQIVCKHGLKTVPNKSAENSGSGAGTSDLTH
jgi:hypothetical protein